MSGIYDLIVLGGGPAGYCAAERAAAAGMRVMLTEKRALGGVCLNEGCIPSKTLLNSAKALHYAADSAAFGITTTGAKADVKKIIERKRSVVKTLVNGVAAKMKRHNVDIIYAEAAISGRTDGICEVRADGETHRAKRLLIAAGSAPVMPNIPGVPEAQANAMLWTSREALDSVEVPPRFAVVGGGVIGLEMACYYKAMGADVTVIEMLGAIGGPLDSAIAAALYENCAAMGVQFFLNAKVTKIGTSGVTFEQAGKEHTVPADKVLMSVGRRPVVQGYGLENLNITLERGAIPTDASGRTAIPDVYAAGDVNGRMMLAHTAYREAECAVAAMLGRHQRVDYDAIPAVIYTNPEVACVGITLEQALSKGYKAKCVQLPMAYSGRYVAEADGGESLLRMIVDEAGKRVLGVHMIGPYASEIIYGAVMMVATRMPVEALRGFVYPHPTVSEVLREALWEA